MAHQLSRLTVMLKCFALLHARLGAGGHVPGRDRVELISAKDIPGWRSYDPSR